MNEKSKMNRAKREARQEERAQNVIKWFFIALLVCTIVWITVAMSV